MTQEYQLRILPEIAANEQKLKEYLSKEKGLNLRDITATRILKRSIDCLLYTSPSPRYGATSRIPSSA